MSNIIYKVTISGIHHNQNVQNVMNFEDGDSVNNTEQALALDIRNNWIENIRFLQNIDFVYTSIKVQRMLPQKENPILLTVSNTGGTLAGASAHCGIAAIFSFHTLNPTRKGRGRYFMGGVHGASIDHSLVQANAFNQYIATANILSARYCGVDGGLFRLRVGPRTYQNSADYKLVDAIVPRNYFALMHTRNINVGG